LVFTFRLACDIDIDLSLMPPFSLIPTDDELADFHSYAIPPPGESRVRDAIIYC